MFIFQKLWMYFCLFSDMIVYIYCVNLSQCTFCFEPFVCMCVVQGISAETINICTCAYLFSMDVKWIKNGPEYYEAHKDFILENELLTILAVFEAVPYRTIYLLIMYMKIRRLISVSRAVMEKTLKSTSIVPKILAQRSNAMQDILLATIGDTSYGIFGHSENQDYTSLDTEEDHLGPSLSSTDKW